MYKHVNFKMEDMNERLRHSERMSAHSTIIFRAMQRASVNSAKWKRLKEAHTRILLEHRELMAEIETNKMGGGDWLSSTHR